MECILYQRWAYGTSLGLYHFKGVLVRVSDGFADRSVKDYAPVGGGVVEGLVISVDEELASEGGEVGEEAGDDWTKVRMVEPITDSPRPTRDRTHLKNVLKFWVVKTCRMAAITDEMSTVIKS